MFLFTFFSLSLIFTLVVASISHLIFFTTAIKFACLSSNEIGLIPLFFISHSSSFSQLSRSMQTLKSSRKKESALLLLMFFYLLKSRGGYAIYCQNACVLEMQNFTAAYMNEWKYVRTEEELRYYPESQSKRKNVQGGHKRDVATIVYCFGRLQYASLFFFTYFHAPFCCSVASQLNTLCRCTSKCKALTTK